MTHQRTRPDLGELRPALRVLLVRALPLCRPETIDALVDTAHVRPLRRGQFIYRQGEPVPLTLLLRGYGVARRTTSEGHELMSGVASAGELFGYSGMASTLSSVALVAVTDCDVAQWPGAEVRRLGAEDQALLFAAIESMAASVHATVERIEGFVHQDARRRVLRILVQYRVLFFGDPAVLDRTQLPGLVGTSREMTGRVLRRLEQEGTLERVGRAGLRLLRPDRLDTGRR